ncbi:hypothetical protein MRX96_032846 [Rhipicephalus microplus]
MASTRLRVSAGALSTPLAWRISVENSEMKSSVGGEETIAVMHPVVGICVLRVARAIVNAGTRNKWVHFPRTVEEKAAVKEEFLQFGPLPGVIG